MSDWMDLHLAAPVAANLAALGWTADHPRVKEVAPTTARGHHAVVVAPPVPAWAAPALAGACSHLTKIDQGCLLLVAPADAIQEWAAQVGSLTAESSLTILAARSAGRATRILRANPPNILILSAEVAALLVSRGDLKTERLTGIVLVWPERWAEDTVLLPLMQDLPADAQRILISSAPTRAAELAERYARKALVVGPPAGSTTAGPVRTVATSWARRAAAVSDLVELLDPATLTIWTVDEGQHAALRAALGGSAPDATLTTTPPESAAGLIVAVDLPDSITLTALIAVGEVVLLVPPGADPWLATVAAPRRPIVLPGVIDEAGEAVRRRRAAIARAVGEDASEAALVLAPLLERYEAPAVAAALYALWVKQPAPSVETPAAAEGGTEKLWIGIGKRDEVGVSELVAFLTRELAVDRAMIGRIEVRDTFTLIEVPRAEASRIAEALSGRTIRRRRLVARVDRGAPAGGPRPPRGRTPA